MTRVIANAKCCRFEVELHQPEGWRQLVYLVPGGEHYANLQVAARRRDYERVAQQLDQWVMSFPGIVESPPTPHPEGDDERFGKLGAVIGGGAAVGLFVRWLVFGGKKPRQRARPPARG